MSEIIKAFEDLEKRDVKFEPHQSNYVFYTNQPSAISKKKYDTVLKRLTEDYNLDIVDNGNKVSRFDRILNSKGRLALVIDTRIPNSNKVEITRFEISRNYENVKRLADYMLRVMTKSKARF